ncbi:cyclic peptide export ABC transporter [Thermopolyspora sp. NPDC052614]|uniref:cyclic peptide export ABC transporter n=1 Tax=Thermopolyspora sp. NPDC052614 TaxID=3155682 RepID=UPI0034489EF0
MRLVTYLFRSARGTFLLALAAGLVSGIAGAAFIAPVNAALGDPDEAASGSIWIWYVALCLIAVVTRAFAQIQLFRLSQQVIYRLRRRMVDAILDAPLRAVETTGTPRLYSALADDVVVVADALPGLPLVCSSAAFLLVVIVYLVIVSPVVALVTLAAAVAGVAAYRAFAAYGMRYLAAARTEQDALFEHFRTVVEGVKELKLNRARRDALAGRALDATAMSYRRHSVVGLSVFEAAAGSGQAIIFALVGVLLFALPAMAAIPAASIAAAVLVILFAVSSLQGVLVWLPTLGRASIALGSIEARLTELETAGREEPATTPTPAFGDWRSIRLHGVRHVYRGPTGEEFTLGPLDLRVRRGEVLFVVGGNGSGKTTLAKLITGLYPPQGGTIRIGGTEVTGIKDTGIKDTGIEDTGVEITDADRDAYRQQFSAVFSDFHLFDNLLGLPPQDLLDKARHYLARLRLDHKVSIVDDRFSATALSQGQRKRLALLLAFLEDRPAYVFDEWAADQDPEFKRFFYRELLAELKARDKAVVVISHDDRYFDAADRLVRLDYGQISDAPAWLTSPPPGPGDPEEVRS